jgi:hypothetical protein
LDELITTIWSRQIYPIGSAVNIPTFNTFSEGERRYLTNARITPSGDFITSGAPKRLPYQLAFSTLLYAAAEKVKDDVRINFVFDRNKVEEGLSIDVFNHTKDHSTLELYRKLNEIRYTDRQSQVGLQAADLYACLWNSKLQQQSTITRQQEIALSELVKRNKHHMDFWERAEMEHALSQLTDTQRETI